MLPFDNFISYFDITGANLKTLLTNLNNGQKKFYPQWGLSETYKLNGGKYELLNLVMANGSPIIDTQIYTGATIKFLLDGGDDFTGQSGLFTNIINTSINIKKEIQDALYEFG
jgi:2',3'-cyclic-nucleotide 2'-phosphodiesterase (5'-nucleotidase family)